MLNHAINDNKELNTIMQALRPKEITPKSHQNLRPLSSSRSASDVGMVEMLSGITGSGQAMLVNLTSITESPYQTSPLNEERVVGLVENLKHNPLASPVVLRKMNSSGRYETVAGHHRVEAYRRLGRSEIEATICDINEDEAERLVFYDNLLAPNLSDYEKYQGFSRRRSSKGLTMEQLAEEAGITTSMVSMTLAFDKLPESVHAVLRDNPAAIGAKIVPDLAKFAGHYEAEVIQVIKRVIAGEITQKAAIDYLKGLGKTPTSKPETKRSTVLVGNTRVAEIAVTGQRMSITLTERLVPEKVYACIESLLQEMATEISE